MERVALVTGANRGIGLEIAREIGELCHRVILGARNIADAEAAAKKLTSKRRNVFPAELDVTNQATIEKLLQRIDSDFGRLDVLVNNAGILIDETDRPSETQLPIVKTTIETNLSRPMAPLPSIPSADEVEQLW